ncbi:MAG: bifunctional phosphoribosyl-AMP cyclohydrolase/phosphoribosyl-ATP diphosphatase HisIE [Burkholderia sp.]|nr:bifunctional phosphoribosyl-AMP cyclohydrolase/phosphoribosyl-ATP diphosphatase HisIE [Burkholderia sp.]
MNYIEVTSISSWLDRVCWNEQGLVPVITQEAETNDVLMFAWMNRNALSKTIELRRAVYYSRSRQRLWFKGEESGHIQYVLDIRLDCDNDSLLMKVKQVSQISCHTGRHSCFFHKFKGTLNNGDWVISEHDQVSFLKEPKSKYTDNKFEENILIRLTELINSRRTSDPSKSYVSSLFNKGDDVILKKVGEEATEVVLAAKSIRQGGESASLVCEVADLLFHCLIMLSHFGITLTEVISELEHREGISGLKEKALRKYES